MSAKKSGSLNTNVTMSARTMVLFALVFGFIGGYAVFKSLAAPAPTITSFSIAEQSVGSIKLSASTTSTPSTGLIVTSKCYDDNSLIVSSTDSALTGWISDPSVGYVGYATFNGTSGLKCFAYVHKSTGKQTILATLSYVSP